MAEYKVEPDWTRLSSFTLGELPRAGECKGCGREIQAGSVALFKLRQSPHNKTQQILICVHDEECLSEFDHWFWQNVARKRKGRFSLPKFN